jgi:hypothetical protein
VGPLLETPTPHLSCTGTGRRHFNLTGCIDLRHFGQLDFSGSCHAQTKIDKKSGISTDEQLQASTYHFNDMISWIEVKRYGMAVGSKEISHFSARTLVDETALGKENNWMSSWIYVKQVGCEHLTMSNENNQHQQHITIINILPNLRGRLMNGQNHPTPLPSLSVLATCITVQVLQKP